jgi:hypothetical protein
MINTDKKIMRGESLKEMERLFNTSCDLFLGEIRECEGYPLDKDTLNKLDVLKNGVQKLRYEVRASVGETIGSQCDDQIDNVLCAYLKRGIHAIASMHIVRLLTSSQKFELLSMIRKDFGK